MPKRSNDLIVIFKKIRIRDLIILAAFASILITGLLLTRHSAQSQSEVLEATSQTSAASSDDTEITSNAPTQDTTDETTPSVSDTTPSSNPATTTSNKSTLTSAASSQANTSSSSTVDTTPTQQNTTCAHVRTGSRPTQALTVTLRINDCATQTVTLPAGSSQCDALTAAVTQGVLASVDIHMDPGVNKPGVYRINGQGDARSVWWVYYVNGNSPPKGCSEVAVQDGDSIYWKYLK